MTDHLINKMHQQECIGEGLTCNDGVGIDTRLLDEAEV